MRNGYTNKYTLSELFNNPYFRRVLPQVNYRELKNPDGGISRRTNLRSVNRIVFDTSENTANKLLTNVKSKRSGDSMEIVGDGNIANCVEAVYNACMRAKRTVEYTANNMNIIRSALKAGMKQKAKTGSEPKLFLRAESLLQIKSMNDKQLRLLLNDVMENIYFNGDFYETQQKFGLEERLGSEYKQYKDNFDYKVGKV